MFSTLLALIIDYNYTLHLKNEHSSNPDYHSQTSVSSRGKHHDVTFVYEGKQYFCFHTLWKEVESNLQRHISDIVENACFLDHPPLNQSYSYPINTREPTNTVHVATFRNPPYSPPEFMDYYNFDLLLSHVIVAPINPDNSFAQDAFTPIGTRNRYCSTFIYSFVRRISAKQFRPPYVRPDIPPENKYSLFIHNFYYSKDPFSKVLTSFFNSYVRGRDDYVPLLRLEFNYKEYSSYGAFNNLRQYRHFIPKADIDHYIGSYLNNIVVFPECEGWHPDNLPTSPAAPNNEINR